MAEVTTDEIIINMMTDLHIELSLRDIHHVAAAKIMTFDVGEPDYVMRVTVKSRDNVWFTDGRIVDQPYVYTAYRECVKRGGWAEFPRGCYVGRNIAEIVDYISLVLEGKVIVHEAE